MSINDFWERIDALLRADNIEGIKDALNRNWHDPVRRQIAEEAIYQWNNGYSLLAEMMISDCEPERI